MESRVLLNEIPAKEFHSAIFTTYSINLYYLEQQVLPMLAGRGIYYVSVLADSNMLSEQLESMSSGIKSRQRTYSINGMQSNGAFHPKLIFLAGDHSLLLLIGSGNLTSSGHGKNLEVWNAVYADEGNDSKLGLIFEAWNYLKSLHKPLGESATNKIRTIEENCSLLKRHNIEFQSAYDGGNDTHIRFLHSKKEESIFSQLKRAIGTRKIDNISIMSPFYDTEGNFLSLLNDTFKPKTIKVILQKDFGNAPVKYKPSENVSFYDWENVKCKEPQHFFHAKNLIFEGETSFMLSGSANASIAAFGLEQVSAQNEEACILYESSKVDFVKHLDIKFGKQKANLNDYHSESISKEHDSQRNTFSTFIVSAEKNYHELAITIQSEKAIKKAVLNFMSTGNRVLNKEICIEKEFSTFSVEIGNVSDILYCYLSVEEEIISNKQFITDIIAFEGTNPSPRNRTLNLIRKTIEDSGFSTFKILDYLGTMYNDSWTPNKSTYATEKKVIDDEIIEEDSALLYIPYSEIKEKTRHFEHSKNGKAYLDYYSVRLWDSIFKYIEDNKDQTEQSLIDEEETEDVNKSEGKEDLTIDPKRKPVSRSVYETRKFRLEEFLINYIQTLEEKVSSNEPPSIIDLSMYLIILEVLLQHVSYKERLEDSKKEMFLINPNISNPGNSWSGFVLKIVGLFNLWWNKTGQFKDNESKEYRDKIEHYKQDAFCMTVMAMSLFRKINSSHIASEKVDMWTNIELLNALNCFLSLESFSFEETEYSMFLQMTEETFLNSAKTNLKVSLDFLRNFVGNAKYDSKYYYHSSSGFVYSNPITYESIGNIGLLKCQLRVLF